MEITLLDLLTYFRRYFKAYIDNQILYIISLPNEDLKATKFLELKVYYKNKFLDEYKTCIWIDGEQPITNENLDDFAYEFVEDMFNDYIKSLKKG